MLRLSALALFALVAACDGGSVEAQRAFETEALAGAISGVTRTDATGTVTSEDPSDWRIGPAYVGRVAVLSVPFPNPVERRETVSLSFDVNGGVPGGLTVAVLDLDPLTGLQEFQELVGGDCPSASASTICALSLSARQIDVDNTGGVYRLVVLDNNGVVTYGDVEVQT